MDPLHEFAAELAAALRASPPLRARLAEAEPESGLGAARALAKLVEDLSALGGVTGPDQQKRTFALALKQVYVDGRPVAAGDVNKPDISFIGDTGGKRQRVNIEIETQKLTQHAAQVNRDPHSHNIFLQADPWTGEILGGLERVPGTTTLRTLSKTEANSIASRLPKPQIDPTLRIDQRTGKQRRVRVPAPRFGPPRAQRAGRLFGRLLREADWEAALERAARELEG